MRYTIKMHMPSVSLDEALERVHKALADEGFGVLSDIDVGAKLREKTGADIGVYRILGACNPHFAKEAIDIEPEVGVLLPCNVVVSTAQDGFNVTAIDPVTAIGALGNHRLSVLARTVRERLQAAVEKAVGAEANEADVASTTDAAGGLADLAMRMKVFEEKLSAMSSRFRRSGSLSEATVEKQLPPEDAEVDELQRDMAALNGTFAHVLDFLDKSERKSYMNRHFS